MLLSKVTYLKNVIFKLLMNELSKYYPINRR